MAMQNLVVHANSNEAISGVQYHRDTCFQQDQCLGLPATGIETIMIPLLHC